MWTTFLSFVRFQMGSCNSISDFLDCHNRSILDSYSGGTWFKSQLWYQISWLFLWFSLVPPAKCRGSTLFMPWPLPSKSHPNLSLISYSIIWHYAVLIWAALYQLSKHFIYEIGLNHIIPTPHLKIYFSNNV